MAPPAAKKTAAKKTAAKKTAAPPEQSATRARIHSRPPTGKVTWPCILIEGEEKAGKTWLAYELSKSERIGDAFAIDLGEGSADEYAPIGSYEVLMADPENPLAPWTFQALLEQVAAVRDYAREQIEAGEKPVLLTIDTMSDEWGVLVDAITAKAARSEKNRKLLREDPAAEIRVPNHLWNDANAKHRRLMTLLLTFPGIVVMTAKGREVAEIKNGAPVEGSKVWKVEGQKNLAFDASAWIRMRRNGEPTLEGCRSVRIGLRPGIDAARVLPDEFREGGLEWFIFEQLGLDPENAAVRQLQDMTDDGEGLGQGQGPTATVEEVFGRMQAAWNHKSGLLVVHSEVVNRGMSDVMVSGPNGDQVRFVDLIVARGRELAAAEQEQRDNANITPPAADPGDPEAEAAAALRAAAEEPPQ